FVSAVQNYLIAIVVPIVVLQYAFALFCLLKLAYFDASRKQYILWNIFILIVFFIGGAVFLVYYFKHPEKRIAKEPTLPADDGVTNSDVANNADDGATDAPAPEATAENTNVESDVTDNGESK
ncbi:MAG: hypothetical protein K2L54_00375, partial [Clostridiales bacterium]|nr:hypothetical protein [Clostridiales bacterium]